MVTLYTLVIAGVLCAWAVLRVIGGERDARLAAIQARDEAIRRAEADAAAAAEKQKPMLMPTAPAKKAA